MTNRAGLLGGGILLVFCIALAIAGIILIAQSAATPEFNNAQRAYELQNMSAPAGDRAAVEEVTRQWANEMHALRTGKWRRHDLGRGLITVALCLIGIIVFFRLWDVRNALAIETPGSLLSMLLMITGTWLSVIVVNAADLSEAQERHHFPHWADSIGIPISSVAIIVLAAWPILLIGGWISARGAPLPVTLWAWDAMHPRWSAFWSAAYGTVALLILVSLITDGIRGYFLYIPLQLLAAYLVLSGRAAHLSRNARSRSAP